jgi:hypothetical protein
MDADYAQRRRVALAIAVTVIAVPAAFLLNRGSGSDPVGGPVTVVGTLPPAADAGPASAAAPSTDLAASSALGTAPVGYLSGTTVPIENEPARIAIPRVKESVKGDASFSSSIESTLRCQARVSDGVPFNATLTVTNLDNGRSVQCIASIGGAEPLATVVVAPATFAEIADMTDAPVPVEITWSTDQPAPP